MSGCNCGGEVPEVSRIMYPCDGCADVGEVSDQVCRKLRREGFAQASMSCLSGIAAHMQPFIDAAKKANQVVAVDGCPVGCAKKVLEHVEISPISYVLTQMGLEKGKTEVTQQIINEISEKIKAELSTK
ncbi:DGC domain protein [Sporomusa ovata DSM 2662]|uniref:Zinc-binding protein n=1 Tax=Sporomusa ovata TaxID=2378 RepID=A0A0U1KTV8_9FIRM|nr:putative zinc-binding protein [Sporomusa ovata]EQB26762.1 hypothetical protein SOV_3c06360 [Sporomusa ovata DSM 2662]CQR70856.1 hypothetical protein SpAn4DRAFT_1834 [Sporomusa ovata]